MNLGDEIRNKNNTELAKFLACEACEYGEFCTDVLDLNKPHCSELYQGYKGFLDVEIRNEESNKHD